MKLLSKILYVSIISGICLLVTTATVTLANAGGCNQKRTTAQAPNNILNQKNPLGATPDNVSAGEKLYQKEAKPLPCAQCHGVNGKGDGVLAKGMSPPPRDFSCAQMMEEISDGQLFWTIKNGSKGTGMMAFGTLSDTQIWQVITFIKKLSQ